MTNGIEVIAYIPGIGHNLQEHSVVLIRGGSIQGPSSCALQYIIRGALDTAGVANRGNGSRSEYGAKRAKAKK